MNKKRKGKWMPFDALEGFRDKIHEINEQSLKVNKPILDEQQFELINETLIKALEERSEVEVIYFDNGRLKNYKGIVLKVDLQARIVNFKNKKIFADDIIEAHEI